MISNALAQEPIYFWMAALGTVLFLIKILLLLLSGDGDLDVDGDTDIDIDGAGDSAAAFTLFSVQSILAFIMGAGWMGLASRIEWGWDKVQGIGAACGFGLALMFLSAFLTFSLRKMNHSASYDLGSAVGSEGRVYMKIPAKGEGQGQVEISVNGRRKIVRASSDDGEIESFKTVKIISAEGNHTVVVKPVA